jgi:putative membrane protein
LLATFLALFIWSVINPHDFLTWFLEVFPAIIGVGVLIATYKRFRLTNLVYVLIWIHASILLVGGHYTYAEMPLFNWLRDTFHLARNYYDRVGHVAQGFVPAIIVREFLLRRTPLRRGAMLFFLVVCVCLAVSASYELIEWGVAMATGSAADAFLGTQGDVWDTQWDMFFALCGSILSLMTLNKLHDRQLPNC